MKILHTSDWHLGRTFHGTSLHDVSERFIDELIATVAEENIDAVLISGDVYDNATPSTETIQLLNRALTGLVAAGAQVIFEQRQPRLTAPPGIRGRTVRHSRGAYYDPV